jgi:hypothetical protein
MSRKVFYSALAMLFEDSEIRKAGCCKIFLHLERLDLSLVLRCICNFDIILLGGIIGYMSNLNHASSIHIEIFR